MPRLQDVERFKSDLAALSRESEILAQWGEEREDAQPPADAVAEPARPEAPPRGLAAKAAAATAKKTAASRAAPAAEPPEEGLPPDFATLLADMSLDSDQPSAPEGELGGGVEELEEFDEAPPTAAESEVEAESGGSEAGGLEDFSALDDFDLAAFAEGAGLGEEPIEGNDEESAQAPVEAPAAEDFGALPDAGFAAGGLVDETEALEALPGFDLDESFGAEPSAEAPAGFELPAAESPESPESPESTEAPESIEELSSLDEFALPDLDEGGGAPAGETFDLGGFDFGETEAAAPEETTAQAEAFEADGAEGPGEALEELGGESFGDESFAESFSESVPEEGSGAAPLDDFSIPDFGDLGAEEEGGAAEPARGPGSVPSGPSSAAAAAPEAPAAGDFDAFDSFNFEEGATGFGDSGFGEGSLGGEDLDRELASLGEANAEEGTFNLDKDWGSGFEVPGEAPAPGRRAPPPPRAAAAGPAAAIPRPRPAGPEEKLRPVSLTEAQVDRLQDRLLAFPLNLRVAVEDAVANEKGTEAQRSRLVWMLVEGAKIEEVAGLAGRILQKRVTVPKGYEKSTGAAHEAEKGTLAYALVHTVLPILRIAVLALAAAGVLGFLGWKFIYRPLAANALYRTGYARIAEDRYAEAETAFRKAGEIVEYKSWYYRYAEAYVGKRQYILAERKYQSLLDRYPREIEGALAWARLEKDQLKFKDAAEILQRRILERSYLNRDALLLLGDVYLAWAEEEPKYYEEARRNYAALIQRYGSDDLYLERMLLYFIRTDNYKEVKPLKDRFMAQAKIFPSTETLAELGAYLFDRGERADVNRILLAAQAKNPEVPEPHYHLARYYGATGAPGEERKALDRAIAAYGKMPALSAKRLGYRIDALIRRGEFRLRGTEYLAAEEDFAKAAELYGDALSLRRFPKNARFAAAYAGLAEIAYWMRDDLESTLALLERAADHGYDNPEARYKRGYALYRRGNYAAAIEQLYRSSVAGAAGPYVDYAFGAALYAREDFYAAEGHLRRVVDAMTLELERLEQPDPQGRASHGEIVELLVQAQNNLGAALYKSGNRLGDPRRKAKAMAAFAESARLFDALVRDQSTMVRPDAKNLGFLNMDFVLHPKRGVDLAVYEELPRDMRFPRGEKR
ncbi:MAG: hypothetical protein JNG85_02635 [Spirochaetaceae bacterium]|nr:hypothetical protein [Spirochaetaceae bacterium]